MKKLIRLIALLFLSANIFGQDIGFYEKSIIADNSHDWNNIPDFWKERYYYFNENNTLYVLAYRTDDGIDWKNIINVKDYHRDLILYRWNKLNNLWIEVSNIVQSDYHFVVPNINYGTHKVNSINNYSKLSYITYGGYGKILQLKNGCVLMLLSNKYGVTEDGLVNHVHDFSDGVKNCKICNITTLEIRDNNFFYYCSVVIFIPKGDGTFNATRFEPKNKTTHSPELIGNYSNENPTTDNNKIVIDFNDGADYNGKLTFIIKDGKVNYSDGILKHSNTDRNGKKKYYEKNYELIMTTGGDENYKVQK